MGLFGFLFGGKKKEEMLQALKNGAKIIDVRTKGEYATGHVKGSINIPLNQVPDNIDKIKKYNAPLILCCASGMRSASATGLLKSKGISNVYNGGSWNAVERMIGK